MKLHVICVAYERVEPLEILIRSFIVQTYKDWVLYIIHDGKASEGVRSAVDPFLTGDRKDSRVRFFESEQRYQMAGHPNRRAMLKQIETNPDDFILITNDDNYYVPKFIELMFRGINAITGIVYCDTLHNYIDYSVHNSVLRENAIDMGAFMVRSDVAKETGFNHDHGSADGRYAEECLATCSRHKLNCVKIKKAFFVHN